VTVADDVGGDGHGLVHHPLGSKPAAVDIWENTVDRDPLAELLGHVRLLIGGCHWSVL
jgi:hypothetical protein